MTAAAAISAGASRRRPTRPSVATSGEQAARAEGRVEDADAGIAHSELVDREHDEEHVHRAEEERLRRQHADE